MSKANLTTFKSPRFLVIILLYLWWNTQGGDAEEAGGVNKSEKLVTDV